MTAEGVTPESRAAGGLNLAQQRFLRQSVTGRQALDALKAAEVREQALIVERDCWKADYEAAAVGIDHELIDAKLRVKALRDRIDAALARVLNLRKSDANAVGLAIDVHRALTQQSGEGAEQHD